MTNVIDFPKTDREEDQVLMKDVIDSGKFQKCHDEFFARNNISDLPFQKILMGFYLHRYMQASYDYLE